jgi:flagellar basal-body rod protein FlgC
MDLLNAFKISASGLNVQRTRMNVIASNLANINTTRTPEGGPYRRKEVVVSAQPADTSFKEVLGSEVSKVEVVEIREDNGPLKKVYDPNHPDADEQGYVSLPNVNLMEEMVDMISTSRAYEANVAATSATKSMIQRALEIGAR